MKLANVTRIASNHNLYREGEVAERIEVLKTELADFTAVSEKGKFAVGDYCIYIPTDSQVSDNGYFEEYLRPGGDSVKSKLSKSGRVKAIKFNFSLDLDDFEDKVYSQGILLHKDDLPISFWRSFSIENIPEDFDLAAALGVVKYVAPESSENLKGCPTRDFPDGVYKTDENRLEAAKWQGDKKLRISRKFDGESTTHIITANGYGLCSRNLEKILGSKPKLRSLSNETGIFNIYWNKETSIRGFKNHVTEEFVEIFYDENKEPIIPDNYNAIYAKDADTLVDTTERMKIAENMSIFYKEKSLSFILRGELVGRSHQKRKHNIDSVGDSKIVFFGADDYSTGIAKRMVNEYVFLKEFCTRFGYDFAEAIIEDTFTYESALKLCKDFLKIEQREGLVLRGKKYSAKYINPDYDAKT